MYNSSYLVICVACLIVFIINLTTFWCLLRPLDLEQERSSSRVNPRILILSQLCLCNRASSRSLSSGFRWSPHRNLLSLLHVANANHGCGPNHVADRQDTNSLGDPLAFCLVEAPLVVGDRGIAIV